MIEFYAKKIAVSMQSEKWELLSSQAARDIEDRIDEILEDAAMQISNLSEDPAYKVEVK